MDASGRKEEARQHHSEEFQGEALACSLKVKDCLLCTQAWGPPCSPATGPLAVCGGWRLQSESRKEDVEQLKEELKKGGLTREVAEQVLEAWKKDAGHELTPDDMRKVAALP
jgi:hypothetical protein